MFSRFIVASPITNKDAVTVSNVLFNLFTTFGTCDTIISDQGSELIANVTKEVCNMLEVKPEYTPSFVHHCLSGYERTHSSLAERLTPYMKTISWDGIIQQLHLP